MNVIIVGCGQVGVTLAEKLSLEGNNVTVIDTSAERVKFVTDRIDVLGVVGNGATHMTQVEAGIDKADMLIAVTDADELNLLSCTMAKIASGCKTIARVRSHDYNAEIPFIKESLGLATVINPEEAAADEIARLLRFPSAVSIDLFASGRIELLTFRLPEGSTIVGKSVREVAAKHATDVLFCTAERGEEAFITKGDFVFAAHDLISVIASPRSAENFAKLIGCKSRAIKDAIIVGGGEITLYLCRALSRTGISLRVIERDAALADRLATEYPEVTVINASTDDREILAEEGLEETDAFLAMTGVDDENVVLSLFARSKLTGKLITKIGNTNYDDIAEHLGLDTVIYPTGIVSDIIVRYARALKKARGSNMERLYSVIPGKIEAAEFIVREESDITDTPLSELKLKDNVLVAAIIRDGKLTVPRGSDSIQVGDTVIIVSELSLCDLTDALL